MGRAGAASPASAGRALVLKLKANGPLHLVQSGGMQWHDWLCACLLIVPSGDGHSCGSRGTCWLSCMFIHVQGYMLSYNRVYVYMYILRVRAFC